MNTSIPRWLGPSLVAITAVGIVLALLFGVPSSVNAEDRPVAVTHSTVTHSTPIATRDDYTVTVIPYEGPLTVARPIPPKAKTCQEDEPCWDCHTMGNHICGPSPAVIAYEGTLGPISWGTLPGSRS